MIHAIHRHVDQTRNATTAPAPVSQNLEAILTQDVDPNVSLTQTVHSIRLAFATNALIPASALAGRMQFAMFSITCPCAVALNG